MTDEKKQPTREEQRKDMINSLESNLKNDFYTNILGSNTLRNEDAFYGAFGKQVGEGQYSASMKSEYASKLYQETMEGEEKARENLGIADLPDVPYPTNYQITKYVLSILNESVNGLPLGNLEQILGKTAKGAKLEIPDALKEYEIQREELIEKAHEEGKKPQEIAGMLDKDSEGALQMYKHLVYEALKRNAASKLLEDHRYDDINAQAKKVSEAFKAKKGIKDTKEKD